MSYTRQQLIRACILDLIVDHRAAVAQGALDYADTTHAAISSIYAARHTARIGRYGWPIVPAPSADVISARG